jgi:hypothetical protein
MNLYPLRIQKRKKRQPARGFTLLIAALVGSLLLSIAFAIFNITYKEVILASTGRESQVSFFAADSALECALYWDQVHDAFQIASPLSSISCGGSSVTVDTSTQGTASIREFSLTLNGGAECAEVIITKETAPTTHTQIESYGYNTCAVGGNRKTERALRVTYDES